MAALVRPHVRQLAGSFSEPVLACQRLNQPRVSDAVSDRGADDEVRHPAPKDHGYQGRRAPKDVQADEFRSKVHPPSLCTPPAKNALADLDGSAGAGPGACANPHLLRAVEAHTAYREYVGAGMHASADRQRARAVKALWSYLESLP